MFEFMFIELLELGFSRRLQFVDSALVPPVRSAVRSQHTLSSVRFQFAAGYLQSRISPSQIG